MLSIPLRNVCSAISVFNIFPKTYIPNSGQRLKGLYTKEQAEWIKNKITKSKKANNRYD
jgi:hypothetical protein